MIPNNDHCWCHQDMTPEQSLESWARGHDAECVHDDEEFQHEARDREQPRGLKSVYLELGQDHADIWTLLIHAERLFDPVEGHAHPDVVAALADLLRRSAAAWTEMEKEFTTSSEEETQALDYSSVAESTSGAGCPELAEEQRLNDLADDGGKREPILVWLDHTRKHGCENGKSSAVCPWPHTGEDTWDQDHWTHPSNCRGGCQGSGLKIRKS